MQSYAVSGRGPGMRRKTPHGVFEAFRADPSRVRSSGARVSVSIVAALCRCAREDTYRWRALGPGTTFTVTQHSLMVLFLPLLWKTLRVESVSPCAGNTRPRPNGASEQPVHSFMSLPCLTKFVTRSRKSR